jgi:uncharacterized protein
VETAAASPPSALVPNLVHFARILRGLGLDVTPAREALLLEAVTSVDLRRRAEVKDAARAVVVGRREEMPAFEAAFDAFFREDVHRRGPKLELGQMLRRSHRIQKRVISTLFRSGSDPEEGEPDQEPPEPAVDRRGTASGEEVLARKDFASLTPEEEEEVRRLLSATALSPPPRRSRRWIAARRGPRLDLRRTLRTSLRTGGEALRLEARRRKEKPRPLVVLCDVSGSMESYARILLQFLWVTGRQAGASRGRREAFAFGTRLTRLTRELRSRDVDRALKEATAAVVDWGSGTRIGEALRQFNVHWGRRVLGQGAVVLIISDGWDRGDVDLLRREMARLALRSERLIWLNPLLGTPGYEPLTRGMAAALPFVDDFLPVHNLRSLEQLRRILERARRI